MGVNRMREKTIHRRRAICASLLVIGVFAIPPAVDTAFADRASDGGYVSRIWGAILEGRQVSSAVQDCGFISLDENAPDWMEEICDKSLLKGGVADKDYTLVNFSRSTALEELMNELKASFQARGWVECESGHAGVSTYIKEEGSCRWMMAEFAQTGGEASVVLHIKHA